jgi:hemoglobin
MRRQKSWSLLAILAVAATVAGLAAPLGATQGEGDKTFEKNLDAGLRDVVNRGATIFNNQGDYAGCYRLFEGALLAVKPLLGNYPDLQKKIDTSLANAGRLPNMHDRAHALRKVLDDVRYTMNPAARPVAKGPDAKKQQPLWDRLGGEQGVNKVLSDVFAAAAPDPNVDFTRGGKYPLTPENARILQKSVLDFVSSATGGPYKYTGKSMKEAHMGMGITNEQFNAFAGHLKTALEQNGVAPADVSAVLGAVGGTRNNIVEPAEKKTDDKNGSRN